ncbi:SET domain protein, putative [Plasmodium berghei]|uniref:SET domain protein, putative n=2 Tax=Plasmodium berghei TaxID=5821 RepID=A0A509AM68_PLABA|nr:SET domain protein, putative [Plasmodium berghei ANKA]SCM23999.1 SET domain protein, putative [Plasmodium berghei]SCN26876.1 SET domain protein, putative [Plasmodium berghei]SCO61278.1 SET domain protein, putative [Plasmodium berghei]SCO63297.1 SET domain protein, putative [Plasmodium berghei]VUC56706.1 SET domain protein, putative [Plasmodium berghei ANKA]|eukprot:XP_034422492.1 SET domain protein, putative [Plasmodium berghei ANKA]
MNENIKKEGMRNVEEYNENPYNNETQEKRSFSNNHENIKKKYNNDDIKDNKRNIIRKPINNLKNNGMPSELINSEHVHTLEGNQNSNHKTYDNVKMNKSNFLNLNNKSNVNDGKEINEITNKSVKSTMHDNTKHNSTLAVCFVKNDNSLTKNVNETENVGKKKRKKIRRKYIDSYSDDYTNLKKKKRSIFYKSLLKKKCKPYMNNLKANSLYSLHSLQSGNCNKIGGNNKLQNVPIDNFDKNDNNFFNFNDNKTKGDAFEYDIKCERNFYSDTCIISLLKKKKKKKIYNILYYNEHFRENQYKIKNKQSLKKTPIFYGLFSNKYKNCKLNDINKHFKTLYYTATKWRKIHKHLQCENYNLTLRNIQKRQRLYFYHKENMLNMFNCFIRNNCKNGQKNKTLKKNRCVIKKGGFDETKSLIRGHGYKSNKSEKKKKNNKSNKMNDSNVPKENIDTASNNLVNDEIKMKRKIGEENKQNEINDKDGDLKNDNINNKVKNDIHTEEANKELRITGKSFVKYNQHIYEKYYNDIFLRIGKIVTNKKKIYFLIYKIIKESYFRILILNNEKLEKNVLQVVAIQDVTLFDKNVRIYSDPFYIRNNGNIYGVKFLKFFSLKYFKKKKNIEDIVFSDAETADKNSNKKNIENENNNSKVVKSEKEKKDNEETILSKSGTDTEDNNVNNTNCNSDENEQKENKTYFNLDATKASKDKNNNISINKSKDMKHPEKDTPKSSISSNSNNNTLNYDSDDNEKGKKNQSCKNEKCANMINKKGRNTNSKVKNEKVSNTKKQFNNNDKNSKKADAKNTKNNNRDSKIKKNPNEINKNVDRNKTCKKTNNSKTRYNKNANKEDEEYKYTGVIYNSKRKYYFNITKISDIISMVKGSEDTTEFYLDISNNNMKKKLKLFKKVEKTLFLENLNIDGEEVLFKRPKFFNCIIEEVFENYNILYETEDGKFNMFENKYERLKKNVVNKPENDLSNKYIELKDEERGFRYIGYRVSFELKTDNKKKSTLKTGIIKYYSPKYKQFFIHHIENIKFNLSVDSPKSINKDVSNTRNYSRASSFSYNTIIKDINHNDYNTESNLSNINMIDINYGDPQGCLNANGNKTNILEKYNSENKSPKYNIKMQDEVEKKKNDFIFSDVKGWYSPHFYNIKVLISLKEFHRFDILDKKKEAHDLSILNKLTKCFLCKNNILFIKGHDHYTSTLPTTIYDLSSEAEKKEIDETNTINVHWGVKCFMCSKTFHAECLGDEVMIAKSYDKNVLMKEYKKYIYKNSLKKDKKSTKKNKRTKSPNKKEATKSIKGSNNSISDNKNGKVKMEYSSSKSNTNSNSLQSSRNTSYNCINDLSNEIVTKLKKNITSKTRKNNKILRSNNNSNNNNNNNSEDNESSQTKSDDLNDGNLDDEYSDAENNNNLEKSKTKKSRKYLNYIPSVKYNDMHYKKYICKECYRCIYCCESIYNYKQTPNVANYVICKSCNMVAHGSCCYPNVPDIYLFNWKCDDCLKCSKCDYSNLCFINYNEWELHLDCCINCYKEYEKKNFCIICNEKYKVDDSNKWVECDVCKFWIHLSCDKDEDRNIETLAIKHINYKCPTCRSGSFIDKIERILYLFFLLDKYKNFTFHVPINFYIYWRIVKIPMNLYIMKEKLWGKKYNTISDFLYDFILIVHNAKTVHMPNTPIYKNACNFEKKGKAIIKNMFNMSNEELNKYIDDCLEKYKKIIADDITNNESSNNVANTNIDNNFSIENSKLNNNSNSYNFNMDYMLSKYNENMGPHNNAAISDCTYNDKKNSEYNLSKETINLVDMNKDAHIHQENYNDIGYYGSATINNNDNLGIDKSRENIKNSGDRIRFFQEGYDIKNLENNYNQFEKQNVTDKYNYRNTNDSCHYAESNMLMNNVQTYNNVYETNKDNIEIERNIISKFETSQFDKLESKDDASYINNNTNKININDNPYKKRKRENIEKYIMHYDLHELFNLKKNSFFFQSNKEMFISDKNDIVQYSIININTNSKIYFNTAYNKYDDFDTCKILKIHFLKKYSKIMKTDNCENLCSEGIFIDKPKLENVADEMCNNNDYLNRSTSIIDDLVTKTALNDGSQHSEQIAFNEEMIAVDVNKKKMLNDNILYNPDKNKLFLDADIFMIDIMKEKIKINNVTKEKKRILSPINDTLKFLKCIQIIFFDSFDTDGHDKIVYPLNSSIYQSYKKSKRDMAYINDITYSGKEYAERDKNNKNDNLFGTIKEISIDSIISSVCKYEIIKNCNNKFERNKNYTDTNDEQNSTIKHIECQGDNFIKKKTSNIKKTVEKIKIMKNDILKEYCFICGCVEYKYPLLYCSSCGCSIHYSCANVSQPFLFKLNCYFEHKKNINNILNVVSRNFKCYNCIKCDGCGDGFDDEIKRAFYSNKNDKNSHNLKQFEKGVYNHLYNLQIEMFSSKMKKSSSNSTQNCNNNKKNIMIKNENNLEHADTDASISLVNINNYDDNNASIPKHVDHSFVNSSACENTPLTDVACIFDKHNFADKIEKNETDHNLIPINVNKNNKKNNITNNNFENNHDKNIYIHDNLYTNNMNNKSCEILDTEKSMGDKINNSISKKAEKEKFDILKKGMVNILSIHEQTSKVIKCFCCGKSSHNHCFYRMDKDLNNINSMIHKKNYRSYTKKYNRKGSNKKVVNNYHGNNGINYKNVNSDFSPVKYCDNSTSADNNSLIYFIKDESISKYNLKNNDTLINNHFYHPHTLKNINNTSNMIYKNIQEHNANYHTDAGNICDRGSNNNISACMDNLSYINSIYYNNTYCNTNNIYSDSIGNPNIVNSMRNASNSDNSIIVRKCYEQFNGINIVDLALRKNYISTDRINHFNFEKNNIHPCGIYSYVVPSNEVLHDSYKICLNNVEHDAVVTINDRIFNKRVLNKIYELIDNNKNVVIKDLSHLFNVTEFKLNFALCEILNGLIVYLNNKLNEYNLLMHSNNIRAKGKVDDHINNKKKNISIFDINFISTVQDKINVNENIFKIKSLVSYIFLNDESIEKIFNQSFMGMGISNYLSNKIHENTNINDIMHFGSLYSNNFNKYNNNINIRENHRYSLPIYNDTFNQNTSHLIANNLNSNNYNVGNNNDNHANNTQNMSNINKFGIEQNVEGTNNFNNHIYSINEKDSIIPMNIKNAVNNKNTILLSYVSPNVYNINTSYILNGPKRDGKLHEMRYKNNSLYIESNVLNTNTVKKGNSLDKMCTKINGVNYEQPEYILKQKDINWVDNASNMNNTNNMKMFINKNLNNMVTINSGDNINNTNDFDEENNQNIDNSYKGINRKWINETGNFRNVNSILQNINMINNIGGHKQIVSLNNVNNLCNSSNVINKNMNKDINEIKDGNTVINQNHLVNMNKINNINEIKNLNKYNDMGTHTYYLNNFNNVKVLNNMITNKVTNIATNDTVSNVMDVKSSSYFNGKINYILNESAINNKIYRRSSLSSNLDSHKNRYFFYNSPNNNISSNIRRNSNKYGSLNCETTSSVNMLNKFKTNSDINNNFINEVTNDLYYKIKNKEIDPNEIFIQNNNPFLIFVDNPYNSYNKLQDVKSYDNFTFQKNISLNSSYIYDINNKENKIGYIYNNNFITNVAYNSSNNGPNKKEHSQVRNLLKASIADFDKISSSNKNIKSSSLSGNTLNFPKLNKNCSNIYNINSNYSNYKYNTVNNLFKKYININKNNNDFEEDIYTYRKNLSDSILSIKKKTNINFNNFNTINTCTFFDLASLHVENKSNVKNVNQNLGHEMQNIKNISNNNYICYSNNTNNGCDIICNSNKTESTIKLVDNINSGKTAENCINTNVGTLNKNCNIIKIKHEGNINSEHSNDAVTNYQDDISNNNLNEKSERKTLKKQSNNATSMNSNDEISIENIITPINTNINGREKHISSIPERVHITDDLNIKKYKKKSEKGNKIVEEKNGAKNVNNESNDKNEEQKKQKEITGKNELNEEHGNELHKDEIEDKQAKKEGKIEKRKKGERTVREKKKKETKKGKNEEKGKTNGTNEEGEEIQSKKNKLNKSKGTRIKIKKERNSNKNLPNGNVDDLSAHQIDAKYMNNNTQNIENSYNGDDTHNNDNTFHLTKRSKSNSKYADKKFKLEKNNKNNDNYNLSENNDFYICSDIGESGYSPYHKIHSSFPVKKIKINKLNKFLKKNSFILKSKFKRVSPNSYLCRDCILLYKSELSFDVFNDEMQNFEKNMLNSDETANICNVKKDVNVEQIETFKLNYSIPPNNIISNDNDKNSVKTEYKNIAIMENAIGYDININNNNNSNQINKIESENNIVIFKNNKNSFEQNSRNMYEENSNNMMKKYDDDKKNVELFIDNINNKSKNSNVKTIYEKMNNDVVVICNNEEKDKYIENVNENKCVNSCRNDNNKQHCQNKNSYISNNLSKNKNFSNSNNNYFTLNNSNTLEWDKENTYWAVKISSFNNIYYNMNYFKSNKTSHTIINDIEKNKSELYKCSICCILYEYKINECVKTQNKEINSNLLFICNMCSRKYNYIFKYMKHSGNNNKFIIMNDKEKKNNNIYTPNNCINNISTNRNSKLRNMLHELVYFIINICYEHIYEKKIFLKNIFNLLDRILKGKNIKLLSLLHFSYTYFVYDEFYLFFQERLKKSMFLKRKKNTYLKNIFSAIFTSSFVSIMEYVLQQFYNHIYNEVGYTKTGQNKHSDYLYTLPKRVIFLYYTKSNNKFEKVVNYSIYILYLYYVRSCYCKQFLFRNIENILNIKRTNKRHKKSEIIQTQKKKSRKRSKHFKEYLLKGDNSDSFYNLVYNFNYKMITKLPDSFNKIAENMNKVQKDQIGEENCASICSYKSIEGVKNSNSIYNVVNIERENNITNDYNEKNNKILQIVTKYDEECEKFIQNYYEKIKSIMKNKINVYVKIMLNKYIKEGVNILKNRKMKNGTKNSIINNNKEKNNKKCDNKICFFCNYGNYIYKGQLIPFYDIYMHTECLKWSLNCTQYYNYNKNGVYEYNTNLADVKNNINDTTNNTNNVINTTSNTGNNKKTSKREQMKDKDNSKSLTSNNKTKNKSASNYVDNCKNDAENSNMNKNNKNTNVLVNSENSSFIKNEKLSHDTCFNLMNYGDTNSTIETNNASQREQNAGENLGTNIKKRIKNIKLMERLEYIENKHSFNNYQNIIEVDEDDIKEIIYDSVNSTCFLCGYKNASIYCSNDNCSVKFHLNCAFYSTIIKNCKDNIFFNYKKLFNLIKFNNDTIFCNLNNLPHKKEEENYIYENNYNDIFPIHIIFKTKKIWCNHCWNDKSVYESFYLKKENASYFTPSNCVNDQMSYENNQIIDDNTPYKHAEINNLNNIPNLESTLGKKAVLQENSITCVKSENDTENKKLISYTNDKRATSTKFLEILKQYFNYLLEFYFENGSYYVMDTILHNINESIKIRYKSKPLMSLQEILNKKSKIEKKMKELENIINKYVNKKNDENYIDDKYNLIIQENTKNNSNINNDIPNERHETKNMKNIKRNEETINNAIVDIQKIIDNKNVSNILKSYFILKNFLYIGNFTTLKNENYFFSKKNENSFVKYLVENEQTLNICLSDVLTTNQIKMSSFGCKKKWNENDMANCSINEDNKMNEINSPQNYCIKYVEYDNTLDTNINCSSETEELSQYINDIDNNIEEHMKYKKKSINIYFKNLTDIKEKKKVNITKLQQVSSNFIRNRENVQINKIVEEIDEWKNKNHVGKEKLNIFKKRGKPQEYINDRKWSNTSSNASIADIMLKKECFLNLVTNNNDIYIKQINDKYFLNYKYNTATNNNNLPFNHSKCNVIKIGCHNILNIGEVVKYEGEEIIYPCGFLNMRIFFNLPSSVLFHIYNNANINNLCLKNNVLEKICLKLRATYIFSITLKNNNIFFSIILFPLININYFSEVDAKKFVLAESHNINELYKQFLSYFNYQNEIYITEQYKKFTKKYSKLYEYMAKFFFKSAEHNKSLDAHSFFGLTLPCVIYHIKYKLFKFIWANLSSKISTHAKRECERDEIKKKIKNCKREVKYNDNMLCKYSNIETSIFKDSEKEMEKNTRKITKYKYNINSAMSYRYLMNISSNSRLYVKKSSIHGYGLYAREFINEGEPVIEYIGEYIRNIISDKRETYYEKIESSCYMFRLNENIIIDATKWGNASRFINHSCEPNCFCKIVSCDQNLKHIVIFAKKDILPHEEITYDYQFGVESEGEKLICLCGSNTCLGRMN